MWGKGLESLAERFYTDEIGGASSGKPNIGIGDRFGAWTFSNSLPIAEDSFVQQMATPERTCGSSSIIDHKRMATEDREEV